MLTLQRKADGGFCVRHFYRDYRTWQVLRDGIRYLERRGVKDGSHFSTDTFMTLWMFGWIYYGNTPPNRPAACPVDPPAISALRRRVREFHVFLFSSRADSAWPMVSPVAQVALTPGRFTQDLNGDRRRHLSSWESLDIIEIEPDNVHCDLLTGARRAAMVTVEISVDHLAKREMNQLWLELNAQWRICWGGFDC